jgi:hypothetical protein
VPELQVQNVGFEGTDLRDESRDHPQLVENLADPRLLEELAFNMRGEQMLIGFTFGAREKKQHLVVRVFSDASGEANAVFPEIESKKCNSHVVLRLRHFN